MHKVLHLTPADKERRFASKDENSVLHNGRFFALLDTKDTEEEHLSLSVVD